MPYIIRPVRIRTMAAGVVAAALLSAAAPALAAACPSQPVSHPFAPIGDNASYSLVQGGSFESGAPGWTTNNAEIVADNVAVIGGKHALRIPGESSAISATFCVSRQEPTFRFMVRSRSGEGRLNVDLIWTDSAGAKHETAVGTVKAPYSWAASPALELASNLPLSYANSSIDPVRVVFETDGDHSVEIAGVYIDPYSR
jgi:hypothetical protein